MSDVCLRRAGTGDLPFLREMLYEAAYWNPAVARPPLAEALSDPQNAAYVDGWPGKHDAGLIAEVDGAPVGACWYRFFGSHAPGYGYLDEQTPEISISVAANHRGRGLGTTLLEATADLARSLFVRALSLSVDPANPALRLYERCGYVAVGTNGGSVTMRLPLLVSSEAEPIVRPTARVVVLDGEGRTLLFRAQDADIETGRPFWFPPGGGLEAGETHEAAAQRELFEETGLEDVELRGPIWERVHTWPFGGQWYRSDEQYFVAHVRTAEIVTDRFTDLEILAIAGHRWWTAEEVAASSDIFVPRQLPALLPAIVRGQFPAVVLSVT